MRTWRLTLIITFLLTIALGYTAPVNAHGSGKIAELYLVPVGPYYLSVWSSPGVLRTGEVHFATAVKDAESVAVLDCNVRITLTPLDSDQEPIELTTRVPTEATNFEHEIEYIMKEPGRYNVVVDVEDPSGNGGTANFDIEVIALSIWTKVFLYSVVFFTSFVGLLLVKQGLVLFGLWKPKQLSRSVVRPVRPKR